MIIYCSKCMYRGLAKLIVSNSTLLTEKCAFYNRLIRWPISITMHKHYLADLQRIIIQQRVHVLSQMDQVTICVFLMMDWVLVKNHLFITLLELGCKYTAGHSLLVQHVPSSQRPSQQTIKCQNPPKHFKCINISARKCFIEKVCTI